jgi:hypothetical protein
VKKEIIEKAMKRSNELSKEADKKINDIDVWLSSLEDLERETVYRYIVNSIGRTVIKRESKVMAMMQEVFREFLFSHDFASNFVNQTLGEGSSD